MIIQGTQIVLQQILILFMMIGIGYLSAQYKVVDGQLARPLTNLILMVMTPAVIITAFQVSAKDLEVGNMLIAAVTAVLVFLVGGLMAHLVFHREPVSRQGMLIFSAVFYNAGFFGLPLVKAVLGDLGAAYTSIFVAVFNVMLWTYGVWLMDGKNGGSRLRNLANPGVITVIIVLLFYAFKITLPGIIRQPIASLAAVQSPMAMIIVGIQFHTFREQFNLKDAGAWKVMLLRDLLVPLLILPVIYLLTHDETLFLACALTAATPTAMNSVLFATRYEKDINLAVQMVMLTTLGVIITIPLIMALAYWLIGTF